MANRLAQVRPLREFKAGLPACRRRKAYDLRQTISNLSAGILTVLLGECTQLAMVFIPRAQCLLSRPARGPTKLPGGPVSSCLSSCVLAHRVQVAILPVVFRCLLGVQGSSSRRSMCTPTRPCMPAGDCTCLAPAPSPGHCTPCASFSLISATTGKSWVLNQPQRQHPA